MADLSAKQELFVAHYCDCWIGTDAAERAGYKGSRSTLAVVASQNLRNPKIAAAIAARMEAIMPAGEVLTLLAEQARGTMADFVDVDTETLDLQKAHRQKKVQLIKKFTRTETEQSTRVSIELYDAQAALVALGKYHGLFRDRVEHSLITPDRAATMTDEELDAELKKRGLL